MQGKDSNTNSFIDRAFVDHAWDNMQKMLDEEMPVQPIEEGKKKYLVLLLLLLTGFSAGVGVMYFFMPSTKPPIIKEVPIEKKKVNPTGPIATLPEKNEKISDLKNKLTTVKPNLFEKRSTNATPAHKQKGIVADPVVIDQLIESQPKLQLTEIVDVVPEYMDAVPPAPVSHIIMENPMKLESIDFVELDKDQLPLNTTFKKLRTNKWKWSVEAGMLTATAGITGWTFGLNAEYQINPRFSLQTGLHFNSYRWNKGKEEVIIDNVRLEDSFILPNDYQSNLDNNEEEKTTVPLRAYAEVNNVAIKNRNYIGIPMMLSYQPIPLLKFNVGAEVAYRVKDLFNQNGNETIENLSSDPGTGLNYPTTRTPSSSGINKTDITGTFGLTVFPTKRTGIDFSYNLGFTDYTIDDVFGVDQFDNNKSFQVSLVHYFGRH